MSLYNYIEIKFWLDIIFTIVGLTAFAILLIYNWWHDC